MGLGMSLGLSQSLQQEQRLVQRQSLAQRLKSEQLLSIRVDILEALHPDGNFQPDGQCPGCEYRMEIKEILVGFTDDPNDFETTCPRCKRRFAPRMSVRSNASSVELPFYCEIQTVEMLRDVDPLGFDDFKKAHPAILQSARFYFGTLTNAFARLDVDYEGEPSLDWKEKILPFLGKCPDSVIADCVGKSSSSIQRLRKKHGVAAFSNGTN